jgi:chromosome segregation protein
VELDADTEHARHDVEQCETHILEANEAISRGQLELARFQQRVLELEAACSRLRQDREQWRVESENLSANVKQARTRLEAVESEFHQTQMSVTEVRIRRDDLTTRVRDEMHIDLVERYRDYSPQEEDWTQVETEIAEVRQKMERLGNVNLDAIAELEELETRHNFLTGQRDDLASSQRQLEQLIQRLNDESKERFRQTFDEIRENFRAMFRKLFGGGRADIILEEPENILECGIEILAQPPGKELQTISLMSGGEKSLTAIALLMSIFKSRPAPFAIMDEVDAALDEANNERFNRIVKEFVEGTQFIVITHSRWTMNIADQLYGITMQEAGVSTRVGVELSKAHVA